VPGDAGSRLALKFGKMARAGLAVMKGRIAGFGHPLFVILAVTSSCQSHCAYCRIPARPVPNMDRSQVFSLIDQIVAMGTQRLGLWGGEPLLRADIGDIIRYAQDRGLYVTLDTNGYLLPKAWDRISSVDHLIVSLDGNAAAHDANREPGSWDRVMEGLQALPAGRTVWTITVLTRNNLDQIDWILDTADRMGFVPTFQVLHHNPAMAGDTSGMLPTPEEYRAVLKRLLEAKRAGRCIGTSRACLEHLAGWPDYTRISRAEPGARFRCFAGQSYANVDCDGSVYPCSLLVGQPGAPNFLETGFQAAYRKLSPIPCQSCLATCYTEYNLIFSLHFGTVMEWALAVGGRRFIGGMAAPSEHDETPPDPEGSTLEGREVWLP
jgi:MoaA/NifB/PqqE/SkfB family radical SAM enzyme